MNNCPQLKPILWRNRRCEDNETKLKPMGRRRKKIKMNTKDKMVLTCTEGEEEGGHKGQNHAGIQAD